MLGPPGGRAAAAASGAGVLRRARAHLDRNLALLDVVARRRLEVETLDRRELAKLSEGMISRDAA